MKKLKEKLYKQIEFLTHWFNNQFDEKKRRNFLVFMFFAGLATIFWFLNALSHDGYTTTYTYPVKFINLPEKDRDMVTEMPERLELKLRSDGYTLLGYKLSTIFKPLVIDFNKIPRERIGEDYYRVGTVRLKRFISAQIDNSVTIDEISPDSIFFRFSKIINRKLPIIPNIDFEVSRQYKQSGPLELNPDSVIVSGPGMFVDSLKFISTEYYKYRDLKDTIIRNVALRDIGKVKLSKHRTVATIPVEPYTEAFIKVRPEINNVPEGFRVKLFPAQIEIRYNVGLSQYNDVKEEDFIVAGNFLNISENGGKIKVSLVHSPDYIENIRYNPKKLDFILEKTE